MGKNDETEKLTKILNIDENLLPEKKDITPEIISNFEAVYPFKSLKEYQSTVSFKAIDELQNSASRFVIQMPTGSGKTRVAMEVISEFINSAKKC